MNYGQSQQNERYTLIDNLPDVSEIDEHSQNNEQNYSGKYGKFIRQSNQQLPSESGMIPKKQMIKNNHFDDNDNDNDNQNNHYNKQFIQRLSNQSQYEPSCIDVCNHINSCPLCSKFYNNDKTAYIIIIIILTVICLLLLKKILNI